MSLEIAIFYYFLTLTFVLTPGPGVFAIIAKSLNSGVLSAFSIALGMIIFDLFYLILACYGLSKIAKSGALLFLSIRLIGSIYLIYLGWKMFTIVTHLTKNQSDFSNKKKIINFSQTFLQGALIGVSNPKVILFYLAFLPNFVDLNNLTTIKLIIIIFLTIAAAFTGVSTLTLGASFIKKFVYSPKGAKMLNRVSGSLMILAGIYLLVDYWY